MERRNEIKYLNQPKKIPFKIKATNKANKRIKMHLTATEGPQGMKREI